MMEAYKQKWANAGPIERRLAKNPFWEIAFSVLGMPALALSGALAMEGSVGWTLASVLVGGTCWAANALKAHRDGIMIGEERTLREAQA